MDEGALGKAVTTAFCSVEFEHEPLAFLDEVPRTWINNGGPQECTRLAPSSAFGQKDATELRPDVWSGKTVAKHSVRPRREGDSSTPLDRVTVGTEANREPYGVVCTQVVTEQVEIERPPLVAIDPREVVEKLHGKRIDAEFTVR